METLDTLRAERDEARRITVELLIDNCVDASYTGDIERLIAMTGLLSSCPYPEARGVLDVGLALGNFIVGCAFIGAIGNARVEVENAPLFGGRTTRAAA